ncbi:efflux RND transporter permease subunit [Granulicoccus sp. GXG6511]|uniref:efflux RND transporter permease subunit n=1 Tax=Granulicoccus sp. GXG6511 TaxID=3381351 RepID=UPI003D7EFC2C
MTGLTRISLANRAVVMLVSLIIVGFGIFAAGTLKQEIYPSLTIPGASVISVYPGAAAGTIERDVTRPLEDAVKGVTGVTRVSSVSSTNMSQVQVQWDFGEDNGDMEAKVRSAVEGVRSGLPTDVDPRVTVGSLDDLPVLLMAVSSTKDPDALADELKTVALPRLNAIPGVRDATVSGEQARHVVITTRQADLNERRVDGSQIPQMIQAHRSVVPGGQINQDGQDITVQVGSTLDSLDAIRQIRLQGSDGPVPLGDVAEVADVPVDATTISRVNGKPSLTLSITKTLDANTVTVAHAVHDVLPQVSREIGANTTFATVFDQAPWIEQSIHDLATEGGLGLLMAVLVILLFLRSARSTIITAISIPLSLLFAILALYAADYSLNLLTLSGLTVAVGRVVDDSIVVIENIERHVGLGEEFGPALIIRAVREVAAAVTSSTATAVAVFMPLAIVGGMAGELFRPFALTVSIALIASLAVALAVVPVLAYWFMRPSRKRQEKLAAETVRQSHESAETGLQRPYLPVLRWSLRHPLVTLGIAALVFVTTMLGATVLKTDFLGDTGDTSLSIRQAMPAGTSLAETDAATARIEELLADDPDVETYSTTVGSAGFESQFFGGGSDTNKADISVSLVPGSSGKQVGDRLRADLGARRDIGEVEVITAGGATGSQDLAVQVTGRDEDELIDGADRVLRMMQDLPDMDQVKSDVAERRTVLQVNVRPADAAAVGMNQGTIGPAVLQAMRGTPLGEVTIDGRSQDLVLRSGEPVRTKEELENLALPVTQKQTMDEQQRQSDALQEEQDAETARQTARAEEQFDEQEEQLRDQRAELETQLARLIDQIAELERAPVVVPSGMVPGLPAPGDPGAPTDPAELARAQAAAAAQAQAQAQAQRDAQIEQLRESRDKLREQLTAMDEQLVKLRESRADAAAQRARGQEMQRRSEAIREATGSPVVLRQVADVVEVPSDATIRRVDGERAVTLTAVMTGDDLGAATAALQDGLDRLDLPAGVQATIGGVSSDQTEAFNQLFLAMGVAIVIVYLVMVATFRSLIQPLILLVSVPFAATGAIGLLLVTNTALGIASMIGLLMLIGVVVTNAIVLIDLVNQYRDKGAAIDEAVINGARLRLRPIIMTALATVMALVPMAIGITGGGVFISKSLAIVVIGGLVSSTLLTLILVPVLYHLTEHLRDRINRRTSGGKRAAAAEEETVDLDAMLTGREEGGDASPTPA